MIEILDSRWSGPYSLLVLNTYCMLHARCKTGPTPKMFNISQSICLPPRLLPFTMRLTTMFSYVLGQHFMEMLQWIGRLLLSLLNNLNVDNFCGHYYYHKPYLFTDSSPIDTGYFFTFLWKHGKAFSQHSVSSPSRSKLF